MSLSQLGRTSPLSGANPFTGQPAATELPNPTGTMPNVQQPQEQPRFDAQTGAPISAAAQQLPNKVEEDKFKELFDEKDTTNYDVDEFQVNAMALPKNEDYDKIASNNQMEMSEDTMALVTKAMKDQDPEAFMQVLQIVHQQGLSQSLNLSAQIGKAQVEGTANNMQTTMVNSTTQKATVSNVMEALQADFPTILEEGRSEMVQNYTANITRRFTKKYPKATQTDIKAYVADWAVKTFNLPVSNIDTSEQANTGNNTDPTNWLNF